MFLRLMRSAYLKRQAQIAEEQAKIQAKQEALLKIQAERHHRARTLIKFCRAWHVTAKHSAREREREEQAATRRSAIEQFISKVQEEGEEEGESEVLESEAGQGEAETDVLVSAPPTQPGTPAHPQTPTVHTESVEGGASTPETASSTPSRAATTQSRQSAPPSGTARERERGVPQSEGRPPRSGRSSSRRVRPRTSVPRSGARDTTPTVRGKGGKTPTPKTRRDLIKERHEQAARKREREAELKREKQRENDARLRREERERHRERAKSIQDGIEKFRKQEQARKEGEAKVAKALSLRTRLLTVTHMGLWRKAVSETQQKETQIREQRASRSLALSLAVWRLTAVARMAEREATLYDRGAALQTSMAMSRQRRVLHTLREAVAKRRSVYSALSSRSDTVTRQTALGAWREALSSLHTHQERRLAVNARVLKLRHHLRWWRKQVEDMRQRHEEDAWVDPYTQWYRDRVAAIERERMEEVIREFRQELSAQWPSAIPPSMLVSASTDVPLVPLEEAPLRASINAQIEAVVERERQKLVEEREAEREAQRERQRERERVYPTLGTGVSGTVRDRERERERERGGDMLSGRGDSLSAYGSVSPLHARTEFVVKAGRDTPPPPYATQGAPIAVSTPPHSTQRERDVEAFPVLGGTSTGLVLGGEREREAEDYGYGLDMEQGGAEGEGEGEREGEDAGLRGRATWGMATGRQMGTLSNMPELHSGLYHFTMEKDRVMMGKGGREREAEGEVDTGPHYEGGYPDANVYTREREYGTLYPQYPEYPEGEGEDEDDVLSTGDIVQQSMHGVEREREREREGDIFGMSTVHVGGPPTNPQGPLTPTRPVSTPPLTSTVSRVDYPANASPTPNRHAPMPMPHVYTSPGRGVERAREREREREVPFLTGSPVRQRGRESEESVHSVVLDDLPVSRKGGRERESGRKSARAKRR
ncbi:hypothetical protein KIPB_001228 [Kipferlia bialata]|uniref:Uncharacterized protein n=1 Tax=Kipferlia bialata TaxID=797122 RepID=A0A9K3GE01_9EUKA|nr:hypothetical protein KIPB_001228 [Kipferlia bialata]|eukprot:g1228.t1